MSDGVMIALLPVAGTTDWSSLDIPHMTLVFAGKVPDLQPTEFNELAKDTAALSMISRPQYLRVSGMSVFGDGTTDNPQVNVFTLTPSPEVLAMRRFVENWNVSDFPFTPHVTIGPVGQVPDIRPGHIAFDRLVVGWGDEYLPFNLRG